MIEIVFVTSNKEKLAHARYLCREYNLYISKQKQYGIGYVEPRVSDRTELFKESIRDAYGRWKKNVSRAEDKLFFIEDTSVNIPSLSKNGEEFPGLDIKYWMRENNFNSVNEQLKANGNNRSAIVRSDVALVLSNELQEKTGELFKVL